MIPRLVTALAGLLLFSYPFPATSLVSAQSSPIFTSGQTIDFTLEGKITAINSNKLTVNTEDNIIFHVRFDDKTEFTKKDGSPGTNKDLRIGLRISVAGDLEESGEILAKKIGIQADDSEKKPASKMT